MDSFYRLGIDIGSTTVKIAIIDETENIIFSDYERHFANIKETLLSLVNKALNVTGDVLVSPVITGSGGLSLAKSLDIPFVQEVVAVATSIEHRAPKTDVAIELGGEDAKIIYFENGNVEERMNGICAGGTGSFIDQMASLLQTDASGMNTMASAYREIYPIAARCGVFAKTDIQPLINEGAAKEDLAASVFQAVVNQTISGLACGKPIRGYVTFLGGPLHFLNNLREAFVRTLHLDAEHTIEPDDSHLFAAIGCALNSDEKKAQILSTIREKLSGDLKVEFEVARMEPLFSDEKEYEAFKERHEKAAVKKGDLSSCHGNVFLGIDAGSTTTKVALIGEDGTLLYSFYDGNHGSPLNTAIRAMDEIAERLPKDAKIVHSCSTGYGEALLKSAFSLDEGEVETIAHFYAAKFFNPSVDCILDIGGQDMKCIRIKNDSVDSVQLNEACSSGCGSFIETFAKSLNYEVKDFAKEALFASHPIDLGTRCTVFMNSKVKQAQKEGASVSDISAGLAYSVIKNALFKVIKLTDASTLGKNVVVQGGTFYNDAVLRAFEKIAGIEAIRPDIAGIMGAFGAALIARERYEEDHNTSMLSLDAIQRLTFTSSLRRCPHCNNHCLLTVNHFSDKREFISGNRCERGLGLPKKKNDIPNLYEYKTRRLFNYKPYAPLSDELAVRGTVGLPRVLNMYENFPFWATFFKELKFKVILSPRSSRAIYDLGIESIPSESACYPAKITHGHIEWLISKGVDFIFYPCIPYERNEFKDSNNHYNCPVVTSYAENIKNNVDAITRGDVRFLNPFMAFSSEKILCDQLLKVFKKEFPDISEAEIRKASHLAWTELETYRHDVEKKGEETLEWLKKTGNHGIVICGRPYHIDPEINHGIPELITGFGMAVLTEDSISHLGKVERPLIVLDQWMYHTRMYAAAEYVTRHDFLDVIELNSFGCGVDAVATDGVSDIITHAGKIYTCLKIDEVNNLGAARIRIRSLIAALKVRKKQNVKLEKTPSTYNRAVFTKEMKKNFTILAPEMSPVHFDVVAPAFHAAGYNLVIPDIPRNDCIDYGLKYVNNDACYPSLMIVGQFMAAIDSGKYDMERTALLITQTGGGCRASNYVGFIRRALSKAGYGDSIPVISLNTIGIEKNPGFTISPALIQHGLYALIFGDIFMRCINRTRPYEKVKGSTDALHEKWKKKVLDFVTSDGVLSAKKFKEMCRDIINDFDNLERTDEKKPRVGIVGEILVKFLPAANNHLAELLEAEGAEAVVPDLTDFLLYCFYNENFKNANLGTPRKGKVISNAIIAFLEHLRSSARKAFDESKHFSAPARIDEVASLAKPIVSIGNQTGEGWFLTGEMMELIETGAKNIVCIQPFGCLPNHVVGKGVLKKIRADHPDANLVAIDYDPGASEVNQLNRIKLMLSTAFKNL